jgi:hypothetical protein
VRFSCRFYRFCVFNGYRPAPEPGNLQHPLRGDVSPLLPMRSIVLFFGAWIPLGNPAVVGVAVRAGSPRARKPIRPTGATANH